MKRGTKPKPIEQREREGNPRDHPLPGKVVVGGRDLPKPPAGLSTVARTRFTWIVKLMADANLLDAADAGVVAAAAVALARAIAAGREVTKRGDYVKSRFGETIANPALRVERDSWAAFNRYAEQLGLTPSARARLASMGVQGRSSDEDVAGLGDLRLVDTA